MVQSPKGGSDADTDPKTEECPSQHSHLIYCFAPKNMPCSCQPSSLSINDGRALGAGVGLMAGSLCQIAKFYRQQGVLMISYMSDYCN